MSTFASRFAGRCRLPGRNKQIWLVQFCAWSSAKLTNVSASWHLENKLWQICFWPLPFVHTIVLPPRPRFCEALNPYYEFLSVSKRNGPQPPPSHIKPITFGNELRTYYRKRGSASYIVHEWLLWVVVVVEREREREWERDAPVTSIDITLISRVIMHMITSTARPPYCDAFWACRVLECMQKQGAWRLSARAAGSSDWWMAIGKGKLCVRWSACRGLPNSIS